MSRDPEPPAERSTNGELDAAPGVQGSEALMEGLAAEIGGTEAPDFDEIVRLHARRIYTLAYRLSSDRADAEDLSQEALVRGYLARGRFRGEADFYTYLYRILVNLWKNQVRSRGRWRLLPLPGGRPAPDGSKPEPREPADPKPGPHEWLAGQEQAARLDRALASLSPEHRAVLVLRVAEGLEYEEIAATLGVRIGTVRSRLARARARIREVLER